jgi:hypothetical protein
MSILGLISINFLVTAHGNLSRVFAIMMIRHQSVIGLR